MTTILIPPHPVDLELATIPPHRSSDATLKDFKTRSSSSSSSSCYLSECSVEDLESGGGDGDGEMECSKESSVNKLKEEKYCRICHLSLDECGHPILLLGCSCKGDLASAHKLCALTWFNLRLKITCEICGSTVRNVIGVNMVEPMEPWNEANDTAPTPAVPPHPSKTPHFWQGHKFLNSLLACMVFAFVISWLFHFNVPS